MEGMPCEEWDLAPQLETCEAGPDFGESPCLLKPYSDKARHQQIVRLGPLGQGMSDTYLLMMWSSQQRVPGARTRNLQSCPAEMWAELSPSTPLSAPMTNHGHNTMLFFPPRSRKS